MSYQAGYQAATALGLLRSGMSMQLCGLLFGMVVPITPFPRLGLTAHKQLMIEGMMIMGVGLLVRQTNILNLSHFQSRIIYYGLGAIWITMGSEVVNAWWGTKDILPIAAQEAGATGALPWQEMVMSTAHLVPSLAMIASFATLTLALFLNETPLKTA